MREPNLNKEILTSPFFKKFNFFQGKIMAMITNDKLIVVNYSNARRYLIYLAADSEEEINVRLCCLSSSQNIFRCAMCCFSSATRRRTTKAAFEKFIFTMRWICHLEHIEKQYFLINLIAIWIDDTTNVTNRMNWISLDSRTSILSVTPDFQSRNTTVYQWKMFILSGA